MSPPGRPKGEYRKAQPEGTPAIPPGRPKGEYRKAQPEGTPAIPPGRADAGVPAAWHAAAARALCAPSPEAPAGLVCWNRSDPAARWAVHRNNVRVGLIDALAAVCPVLQDFVGQPFFRAMAAAFVVAHPPSSPVLAEYGSALPGWLAQFGPARDWPCLPELAQLELALQRALHAADAEPLSTASAAGWLADPATLAARRLSGHPSARLLCTRWSVGALWQAHGLDDPDARDAALAVLDLARPEALLAWRRGDQATVLVLPPERAPLVARLLAGCSLAEAAKAAEAVGEGDGSQVPRPAGTDLATTLGLLIRHGALCAADALA